MSLLCAVIQEANKISSEDIKKGRDQLLPKITDLSERMQVLSWDLQNYFVDLYVTSDLSRSLEHMNYSKRKHKVNTDLNELQDEIQSFRRKFGENVDEINSASKKLDNIVNNFNDLCTVVEGISTLERADRDFNSLKYADAVLKIKELQKALLEIEFEGNLDTALQNLNYQSESQLALSLAHLSLDWASIFSWTVKKGIDTLTYSLSVQQNDPVLLQNVLKALYLTERINADLHEFSEFFVEQLLVKIIKHNCEIYTDDHVGALVFNIKIDLNDTKTPSIQTIFNNLMAVFEFLESTIGSKFEADKRFLECFGDSNREAFFAKIIQDCIKSNLPSCETSYRAYKEIALELETFNKFLVDLKYVEAEESPLKKFISNTDLLLYDKKCDKMLSDIRELIKECLPHGTEIVGTVSDQDTSMTDVTDKEFCYDINMPLFFPKCVISQSVKKIVMIIIKHLEESTALPDVYGKQLVLYIKDVAVMYQHLIAEKFRNNLKENPLEIALFFNNCHYLAHTLVGPPWKNILPKFLSDYLNTILMEHVYDLRVVGMEKLSIYLEVNRDMITNKIENNELPWTQQSFDAFDRCVNYVVRYLHQLKDCWYGVLPDRMYEHAMCSLILVLCETMTRQLLLDTTAVADDLVFMLALCFQHTIAEIQDLFPETVQLEAKIKGWLKFTQIPKLFTAHLLEISSLWNENSNITQSFTCEEVRQIIKMRFPDNKYRLKILMEIQ